MIVSCGKFSSKANKINMLVISEGTIYSVAELIYGTIGVGKYENIFLIIF